MPLIDGKYEIISERRLGERQTLFEATAPGGEAVRIVWYELPANQENSFEHYRRTLKRLKKKDYAALRDVVSRPGAHYVAWQPANEARPAQPDEALRQLLSEAGFGGSAADVRRSNGRAKVFDLAFDGKPLPRQDEVVPQRARHTPRRRTPPAWLLSTLVTSLLTIGAAALLLAGWAARNNDSLVTMPELQGEEVNSAARALYELGLRSEPVPVASQEPAGTVLASEPAAGDHLRPGRTVRLSYALPQGSVTPTEVPRVAAQRYPNEVEETLRAAGLFLGAVSRIPADQPAGLVISQSPPAGASIGEGGEVDILVSSGPAQQMTFLPELVGLPVEEARYLARLAGLSPDRILEDEVESSNREEGTVIAQSLRPHQPVPRAEAVLRLNVAVRSGPSGDSFGLPSLVGLSLEEAEEMLGATGAGGGSAGQIDLAVEEVSDRALPEGIVDQLPPAGSELSDSVTVFVNLHPVPVPRPRVTARVRESEPRELEFRWFIEPGIPTQTARVEAVTLQGESEQVLEQEVRGGEILEGTWLTNEPGPVRFRLTLNDQPYGGEQLVR